MGALLVVVAAFATWLWWPKSTAGAVQRGASPVARPVPRPPVEPQEAAFAGYAGSASCKECHEKEQAAWLGSNHALAERAPSADLDRLAFDPPRKFSHGAQRTDVSWTDGAPAVASLGLDGRSDPLRVDRVIGHTPLRQYLVPFPGGRWQTLEASWDPRSNAWFNVYGAEDRRPGEWGHWTGRGMNWNTMCGTCHNTRFRKNYDETTDTYRTAMAERSVGCEACHGPLKEHVRWQRAWKDSGKKDPTLRKFTPAQHMETCAPCHARRSEVTGDLVPGDSFWDHFLLSIVDSSRTFHPDGQILDEDYEYAPFLGSKMHAAGVTCLDCHDPHAARPKLAGNELCMGCHNGSRIGSPIIDPIAHSFHKADGPGNLCVNCHMPQTLYMQRHWRHDHGFTTPDPLLTKQAGIPNACNRCHADKDTDWALTACDKWYGPRMERPSRSRALALARARTGDVAARDPLLAVLSSTNSPFWKAASVALLEPWIEQTAVRTAVVRQLTNDHPLVRVRAVEALAPLVEGGDAGVASALQARLEDPVRSVRTSSAWALGSRLDPASPAAAELDHVLALNSDQPAGQAQRAVRAMSRRQIDRAIEHYGRAVQWDPGSGGLRQDYAVALSVAGRSAEALRETREAVRLEPTVAENHYRLGLGWAESGDLVSASRSLEEAVRLDPRHDRALYNLGLAYNGLGRIDDALNALGRAEQLRPGEARIPYARATILAQAGRTEDARAAATRASDLEPGNAGFRDLLRALGR